MSDRDEYASPGPEQIEALFDLVYDADAEAVATFLDVHRISPNTHLPLGDLPLLYAAVDAEPEKAVFDPTYLPTDRMVRMLLARGSDPRVEHLGATAVDFARSVNLRTIEAAFVEHASREPHDGGR
jgi:hypothetical protein